MKRVAVLSFLLLFFFAGMGEAGAETRSFVRPSSAAGDGLPFSGAVRVGETLYLSGDIGIDENRRVPDNAKDEARLLMESFQGTLAEAGYTMDELVYVTVYCSDVKHYADFNDVYRGYFKEIFPARAFVGVGTLLFDARFEMQGIAVRSSD
jgi:2-iminobutanoate/2-iminopropanoate deaminase